MFGYRGWRKQWGNTRQCGGALVWQLNDCWPVTSWSIVDYYQRKKPAYYAMKRVLAPIAIGIRREHWDWSVAHARPPKVLKWECWVVSKEPKVIHGEVEIRFISIAKGNEIKEPIRRKVEITPNGTTNVFNSSLDQSNEEPHVLAARLWIGNSIVSRDCDWPQPFKYYDFPERGLQVQWQGNDEIVVSSARPTKGLVFEEREKVFLEDSMIDVIPGDQQTIRIQGLRAADHPLRWRYLGME
jgi:beta-mannosidase